MRVRVPATSANLGPGFDALGLALGWYDDVEARVVADGVSVEVHGEGAGQLPDDERHLVVRSVLVGLAALGVEPPGVAVQCTNRIPHGRGLGSSAAAIVAGLTVARALVPDGERRLPNLLPLATTLEGHPDNVAACLLGGLTLAWSAAEGPRAVRLPLVAPVCPVVFVPPAVASTRAVRRMLPERVGHDDAAVNAGRAALLVAVLTGAAPVGALAAATEDRLHQRYRAPAMPQTAALVARLREEGVAAAVSGAGPAVLAFAAPDAAARLAADAPKGWIGRACAVAYDGVQVVPVRTRASGSCPA